MLRVAGRSKSLAVRAFSEADDLTVLDGNQAGSFPDERPDLLDLPGPWGSMTTMAPTSAACAARNSAMLSLHDG